MVMPHTLMFRAFAASLVVLLVGAGCTNGPDRRDDDGIVGRPPARGEDPFADAVIPPPAMRAASTGSFSEDEFKQEPEVKPEPPVAEPETTPEVKPEPEVRTTPVVEPEPVSEPVAEVKPAPVVEPPVAVAARVEPTTPKTTPPVEAPSQPQCFSCVRICAQSDPSEDCSQSAEDMICGWGTSDRESDARRLAQAQCDAVLDMARQMPRWRSIDGECPAASCR